MIGSRVTAAAAAVRAEGRVEASAAAEAGMLRSSAWTARKAVVMAASVSEGGAWEPMAIMTSATTAGGARIWMSSA
jgi:hypothetical protein